MKQVIQLDAAGYFVGFTTADESPLEEGVYLMPAGTIDTNAPAIPEGKRAKWDGAWVFEDIPQPEPEPEPIDPAKLLPSAEQIEALRKAAYREESDPLFFKWQRGEATEAEWIAAVNAIKARYPEPT
jgi:hypothetical protein